ncbi:hypothetical protein M758_11G021000 [Ceratodon purpureus]|nr:hypothetical protein M758_11G021000 [Ceratodon purpureus]
MESTSNAFFKGATKVRPFRWSFVSVSFVLVACLLMTTLVFNERFPDIVSVVTGGKGSNDVTERGYSTRVEAADLNLARAQRNQSGEADRSSALRDEDSVAAPPHAMEAPPTTSVAALSDEEESDVPVATEESNSDGREQYYIDEEGDTEKGDEYHFQRATFNGTLSNETMVNYTLWDSRVGCEYFREKHTFAMRSSSNLRSLQNPKVENCSALRQQHVSVLVKYTTWIPATLNNLYSCDCGLTCTWTNADVFEEKPDVHLYESHFPPSGKKRDSGEPWIAYMELEPHRRKAPSQDLFISFRADDDLQVTYAGASYHPIRNYFLSPLKHANVLVYWSSSHCVDQRQKIADELLGMLPHHSFGKCLNNVGGLDMELRMHPVCTRLTGAIKSWSQNLHCAMSHYKFVLAIENTITESYVTEKLFYALDAGSVPIYFGAPNVLDFVPPNSIIEGFKFESLQKLAEYVQRVGNDPVLYAQYHAWRRCGVMGPYGRTRGVSLDSLPCRLCAAVSKLGGRNG